MFTGYWTCLIDVLSVDAELCGDYEQCNVWQEWNWLHGKYCQTGPYKKGPVAAAGIFMAGIHKKIFEICHLFKEADI